MVGLQRALWRHLAHVVRVVDSIEKWSDFSARYGDWGRDAALWFGRRQGRLPLATLGELAGGMDYAAVSIALHRFAQRLTQNAALRQTVASIERNFVEC